MIAVGAEGTLWETMEWRFQGPRRGEIAKGNCGTRREVPVERRFLQQVGIVLAVAMVCTAQPADVHLNCTAISETGEVLAKGSFRIGRKERIIHAPRCDTRGHSPEPAPMYMLFSYVFAPTDRVLFLFQPSEGVWDQRIGKPENGKGRARTVFDGNEPTSCPAGTFREVRKYRTTVSDAQGDSKETVDFTGGVRYLWFAKGIGLVRMRSVRPEGPGCRTHARGDEQHRHDLRRSGGSRRESGAARPPLRMSREVVHTTGAGVMEILDLPASVV